jgi:hypothetical protein
MTTIAKSLRTLLRREDPVRRVEVAASGDLIQMHTDYMAASGRRERNDR